MMVCDRGEKQIFQQKDNFLKWLWTHPPKEPKMIEQNVNFKEKKNYVRKKKRPEQTHTHKHHITFLSKV